MGWVGKPRALIVVSPDPVLAIVSSIGLASVIGSALVVDFGGRGSGRSRTLADLVSDGPTRSEMSPGRSGVAIIPSGPISEEESVEVLSLLAGSWPALIVRGAVSGRLPFSEVPVRPLFPGMAQHSSAAVWQPTSLQTVPPGPGPVLPRLRRGLVSRILRGRHPGRGRWVRSWQEVWDQPWA